MFGRKSTKINAVDSSSIEVLLKTPPKSVAARRFMAFCQTDFPTHAREDGFDPLVYKDAVQLVITRLEAMRHQEPES